MNFEEAHARVMANYPSIIPSEVGGIEAIWFHSVDHGETFQVDEEHIGIKADGSFIWAYASGCSCWDGDYEVTPAKADEHTIKALAFNHDDMSEEWLAKFIVYAEGLPAPESLTGTALPESKL